MFGPCLVEGELDSHEMFIPHLVEEELDSHDMVVPRLVEARDVCPTSCR